MKVLYVSKALVVASYRAKLPALARHVQVRGIVPDRWGEGGAIARALRRGDPPAVEPFRNGDGTHLEPWPVLLPGHNHFHLYRGVERLFAQGAPDLLHVDEEPYSAVTLQLLRHARRQRVPLVFFAWQNLAKRLPPPLGAFRALVLGGASGAIAGTDGAANVLRRQGWRGPLAVIPQFGVDPRQFRPDPGTRAGSRRRIGAGESDLVVGYGGRLAAEKGVRVLIEAVAGLSGRTRLLLIGDGPDRSALAAAAGRVGIGSRVHFVGHRPSHEMPLWLSACDVLALPSVGRRGWVEQFGRILVEAMACGVPVVGARSGEIPGVIGEAGLIVPAGDAAALARALRNLRGAPERRSELAEKGRKRVLARFTHDAIAARTAAFYRRVRGDEASREDA